MDMYQVMEVYSLWTITLTAARISQWKMPIYRKIQCPNNFALALHKRNKDIFIVLKQSSYAGILQVPLHTHDMFADSRAVKTHYWHEHILIQHNQLLHASADIDIFLDRLHLC
ncbi:hypothetical protein BDBG_17038 [Blastomyces gilchristii SLH14081]|uniref:Uncharacterized protein n=1 Tax=Blastomyces gilchristii (strain SLH14081) TaxID=559298 RepID=A0A179UN39_BLAGS|nr:uncharacterized protein BDBG_17038 [Blastomyces gilchristii SLH14081]OAT08431.1 hypothetical protein BDBG_17038 [Blastomyces gilchristii SLH14081]